MKNSFLLIGKCMHDVYNLKYDHNSVIDTLLSFPTNKTNKLAINESKMMKTMIIYWKNIWNNILIESYKKLVFLCI